jgi:hypothetical protein
MWLTKDPLIADLSMNRSFLCASFNSAGAAPLAPSADEGSASAAPLRSGFLHCRVHARWFPQILTGPVPPERSALAGWL